MIVLVCGGRDYTDQEAVDAALIQLDAKITLVVHGNARGADTLADNWALRNGVQPARCPANWEFYSNAAGPIRNRAMLVIKPAMAIAFPGGDGTADMIKLCERNHVPVWKPAEEPSYTAFYATLNPLETFFT